MHRPPQLAVGGGVDTLNPAWFGGQRPDPAEQPRDPADAGDLLVPVVAYDPDDAEDLLGRNRVANLAPSFGSLVADNTIFRE